MAWSLCLGGIMAEKNTDYLVAIYGTLRQGQPNASLMSGAKFLGMDHLPEFSLFNVGAFPAAVESVEGVLTVEVYQITESVLRRLDQLEGFNPTNREGSYFVRKQVSTAYGKAWLYLFNRSLKMKPKIASGDWIFHQLNKTTHHAV